MGERFDVMNMSGLPDFAQEYTGATELSVDGVKLRVLPLPRIIASKRAANRTKDQAVLPALELAARVIETLK